MNKRLAVMSVALGVVVLGVAVVGVNWDRLRGARSDTGGPVISIELVADGLTAPLGLVTPPDGSARLFVVDQIGVIRVIHPDGSLQEEPFLDVRQRMAELNGGYDERGLLGLAFHPAFKNNGRFFVYYSAPLRNGGPSGWNHTSHLSEFKVSVEANRADPASERVIMQIDQPQSNHNGGQITFGPDGFLYIPLGDGGRANDTGTGHPPVGNGQDTDTLLGSILRIDVDGGPPYGIPPDNPFAGKDGADEIFAFGFRNPFCISFDAGGSRELFAGDVGQGLWEEVNIVTRGGNYGWNKREGAHFFDPDRPSESPATGPTVDARGQPLVDPILEYRNARAGGIGVAVIGGYVYRGAAIPGLRGKYVFGDFQVSGDDPGIFIATRAADPGQMWTFEKVSIRSLPESPIGKNIRSFGQDGKLELYVLSSRLAGPSGNTGMVHRIIR